MPIERGILEKINTKKNQQTWHQHTTFSADCKRKPIKQNKNAALDWLLK